MKNVFKKLFIVASLFALAGCGGEKKPDPTPDPTPTPETKQLFIEQSEVMLEKFETVQLTYVAKNITDSITWSSENNEICTVADNGLVSGINIGECVITLKAGELKSQCTIYVTQPSEAAVLHLEQSKMNVMKGTTVTIDLYATYKGEKVDGEYTFTPGEGEDDRVIECSYDNYRLSIKGIKAGTTTYFVSATIRDTLLIGEFTITVANV